MKSLEILINLLKLFCLLNMVGGFLFLMAALFVPSVFLLPEIMAIQMFISGLIYLFLAKGLSKQERWSWYIAFTAFIIGFVFDIMRIFFLGISVTITISIAIYILLIYLLFKVRQIFIKQAKDNIFDWFRKPFFIVVVLGIFISYLIAASLLFLAYFWQPAEPQEHPSVSEIEDETKDWQTYRNEEYGFEFKYPEEWGNPTVKYGSDYTATGYSLQFSDTIQDTYESPTAYGVTMSFGLYHFQGWGKNNSFEEVVNHLDKSTISKRNIDISGKDVVEMQYSTAGGGKSTIFLMPLGGNNVLKIETYARSAENYAIPEKFKKMLSTFRFIDFKINWVKGEDYSEHVGSKTVEFVVGEENPYTKILSWPVIKNIPDEEVLQKINDILDFDKNVEFTQYWTKTHAGIAYTDFSVNYDKNNILSITFYIGDTGAYLSESSFSKNIDISTGNLLEITDFTDKNKAEVLNLLNDKLQPIKDKALQNLLDAPWYQDDGRYDGSKYSIQNSRFREDRGHLDDFKVTDEGIEYDCHLDIPHAFRVIRPVNCSVILTWDEL